MCAKTIGTKYIIVETTVHLNFASMNKNRFFDTLSIGLHIGIILTATDIGIYADAGHAKCVQFAVRHRCIDSHVVFVSFALLMLFSFGNGERSLA